MDIDTITQYIITLENKFKGCPCPECSSPLEIMYADEHYKNKTNYEAIAHCRSCLRDWNLEIDPQGELIEMDRHFWG